VTAKENILTGTGYIQNYKIKCKKDSILIILSFRVCCIWGILDTINIGIWLDHKNESQAALQQIHVTSKNVISYEL